MKSRWMYFFETRGFRFGRLHRFKGLLNAENQMALGLSGGAQEFLMEIVPDDECKFPGAEQSGVLKLTLPGDHEDTERAASWIVVNAAEQISFQHRGSLKIHGGLVTGERIPETDEERRQVADKPCFAKAHLVEYEEPVEFDPRSCTALGIDDDVGAAMRQFNSATQAANPVDRFLGLFKVLETLYWAGRKGILRALLQSQELRCIAMEVAHDRGQPLTDEAYRDLMTDLVQTRHRCAHLRARRSFGYVPGVTARAIKSTCSSAKLVHPARLMTVG